MKKQTFGNKYEKILREINKSVLNAYSLPTYLSFLLPHHDVVVQSEMQGHDRGKRFARLEDGVLNIRIDNI